MFHEKSNFHIKYPFSVDIRSGEIAEEHTYTDYVKQLVEQVLFTNPGDRKNRPDFGCGIRQMVFMPINDATAGLTQVMIYQALEKWLGSIITVDDVNVESHEATLLIGIKYTIRSRGKQEYLNIEVSF